MNLILLEENDFIAPALVRLEDRRLQHIRTVHQAETGHELRIGMINGKTGRGKIRHIEARSVEIEVTLTLDPPDPLPVTLILALPRPKMLKRLLQGVTSLGVKQIYLINSYRVEKSFWGSPLLQTEKLCEHLLLGLEQACDTILPTVHLRQRFKPFVEDELPAISVGSNAVVAHPASVADSPLHPGRQTTLAVGPEGGFIPYEIEKLQQCGFTAFSLGERILRVETAVPVLLSRLL